MKLLFDRNISYRLSAALDSLYPGSQHVRDLGVETAGDDAVWHHARDHGMTIVSKDSSLDEVECSGHAI